MQAVDWRGVPEPKIHQSQLEKAKAAALDARYMSLKAWLLDYTSKQLISTRSVRCVA